MSSQCTKGPEGRRPTNTVHLVLAFVGVASVIAGAVWSLGLVVSGRSGGEAFVRFQAAVVSVFVVVAASGLLNLAAGARPTDGLHLLYAVIALALVPLARSFAASASQPRTNALLLVAFVVLGAVTYRLFATG